MGYSLSIGEATLIRHEEDPDGHWKEYIEVGVHEINDPASPAFGEPSDYTNTRWPSYIDWWAFCEFTGLIEIMFDEDGNIKGGHPGNFFITGKFKQVIDGAHLNHMKTYPDATPVYGSNKPEDYHLCRLLWLKYWTDWALENCKNPIFSNS